LKNMKSTFTGLALAAILCLVVAVPASAGTLYDNGPINGSESAWTINFGYAVSDSFTLTGGTSFTLTGVQLGLWIYPGDNPTSLDWSIGSNYDLSDFGSGTGSLTNTYQYTNGYGYYIIESDFSLSDTLAAGTYWLTIQNASTASGDPIYWDINQGPSTAWESYYGLLNSSLCQSAIGYSGTCSDSFQVYGTINTTTTPEPASLALFGSGMLIFAGLMRKLTS